MPLRTIPLDPVTVVLRRPFELRSDRDGNPLADERTGEVVYVAEAVVPGLVASRYNVDVDRPETVRVKQVGGHRLDAPAGSVVRLIAPQLTTWYVARRGGSDARSDVTIRVERAEPAAGETPRTRGGLLAHTAGVGALFLGQQPDGTADVMFDAEGVFQVAGMCEVRCSTTVPVDLIAQRIALVGLRALFVVPDAADVGRTAKSELLLACSAIERAGHTPSNGRTRKPEPEPVAADS